MDQRRAEDKLKMTAETQNLNPQHHLPPPPQKCPRCESSNTKFCYYNNYSLSQPRYFCKACRRYWTQGGSLRNVPVGGGCRKSKRPKPSVSSSSNSANEIARTTATQSLSTALPSQSLAGVISGQGLRANLPPVMPPSIGNSFYTGGTFLSSLAAMQSLPGGINQGRTLNLGGGNSQCESNMTLLHGVSLPSLRTQAAPQHFQNHEFFQSQAIPARPLDSWTQSFTNRATTASSTANPTFWSGANTTSRDNQAGSSFTTPNQWQDKYPGFDPPQ